jgi:hypothetical protein
MERKKNELGDIIVNGKLTVRELYEFAKENNRLDAEILFKNKEREGKMIDTIYTAEVSHFGTGWSKNTIMIHTIYDKQFEVATCQG